MDVEMEQHSETVDSSPSGGSTHADLMSPGALSPSLVSRSLAASSSEGAADSPPPAEAKQHLRQVVIHPALLVKQESSAAAPSAPDEAKQELSVIVPAHEDSSQLDSLSPGKLSPSSGIAGMIDATDFRALQPEPTYQTLTSVNGRMSPPGFSPSSSYATLTPLQPLPPISTMSDKFNAYGHAASNVSGSFTVMQNNGLGGLGMGYSAYDKLPSMGMSPPHYSSPNNCAMQQHSPLSPQSAYSQNGGLHSPQKSMSPTGYESPYAQRGAAIGAAHSPTLSPPSASLHSPTMVVSPNFVGGGQQQPALNGLGASVSPHHSSPSPPAAVASTVVVQSAPLVKASVVATNSSASSSSSASAAAAAAAEIEEINTKELAQRISAELKRRMWKWLQEPEFQRMSALRLAGKWSCWRPTSASTRSRSAGDPTVAAQIPQRGTCKRKEDPQIQQPPQQQQQLQQDHPPAPKKPRLVFTDLQRRTLQAIFKETKRPSKEMQVTIARQLGLEPTTVGNFFMNARRRSMDKWKDETLGDSHSSKNSPQPHTTGQTVVQVGQSAQQQQASSLQQQTVTIHTTDSL